MRNFIMQESLCKPRKKGAVKYFEKGFYSQGLAFGGEESPEHFDELQAAQGKVQQGINKCDGVPDVWIKSCPGGILVTHYERQDAFLHVLTR